MVRHKAMTQDPGRMREREKQKCRVRVREHKCDTPSRPWKGVEEHLRAGRMYRGFEVYVRVEGKRAGDTIIHQGLS